MEQINNESEPKHHVLSRAQAGNDVSVFEGHTDFRNWSDGFLSEKCRFETIKDRPHLKVLVPAKINCCNSSIDRVHGFTRKLSNVTFVGSHQKSGRIPCCHSSWIVF
mmetsp:Transcript_60419/g.123284  ORF Transcript_60419/g.123284 Transcript_60419/m.123284 type:complete len:107 (+) Transcript_60419:1072-1392(+)